MVGLVANGVLQEFILITGHIRLTDGYFLLELGLPQFAATLVIINGLYPRPLMRFETG